MNGSTGYFLATALLTLPFLSGCGDKETEKAKGKTQRVDHGNGERFFAEAEQAYQSGQYQKAVDLFTEAADYMPDNAALYGNRANCHSYMGNLDAALKDYETTIKKAIARTNNPNHPDLAYVHYNRGYAYERARMFDRAIVDFERTIALNRDYPDVKNHLAWLLAACHEAKLRNPKRAVELAEAEYKRTGWKAEVVLDTLAVAYAAAGDFAKATEFGQKAIPLIADAKTKEECRKRLELYRQKKPYVEPAPPARKAGG